MCFRDAQLLNNMYMCNSWTDPVGERSFHAPLTPGLSYEVRYFIAVHPCAFHT